MQLLRYGRGAAANGALRQRLRALHRSNAALAALLRRLDAQLEDAYAALPEPQRTGAPGAHYELLHWRMHLMRTAEALRPRRSSCRGCVSDAKLARGRAELARRSTAPPLLERGGGRVMPAAARDAGRGGGGERGARAAGAATRALGRGAAGLPGRRKAEYPAGTAGGPCVGPPVDVAGALAAVVTVTYNRADYLDRHMASLLDVHGRERRNRQVLRGMCIGICGPLSAHGAVQQALRGLNKQAACPGWLPMEQAPCSQQGSSRTARASAPLHVALVLTGFVTRFCGTWSDPVVCARRRRFPLFVSQDGAPPHRTTRDVARSHPAQVAPHACAPRPARAQWRRVGGPQARTCTLPALWVHTQRALARRTTSHLCAIIKQAFEVRVGVAGSVTGCLCLCAASVSSSTSVPRSRSRSHTRACARRRSPTCRTSSAARPWCPTRARMPRTTASPSTTASSSARCSTASSTRASSSWRSRNLPALHTLAAP